MSTSITGLIHSLHISQSRPAVYQPSQILSAAVRAKPRNCSSTYRNGILIHNALRRLGDAAPLSSNERMVWPYIAQLRSMLERIGVQRIRPEYTLTAENEMVSARCDLLVYGGCRRRGVVEVKVVSKIPNETRLTDGLQLGGYLSKVNNPALVGSRWGAVAYVSMVERAIAVHVYRDVGRMVQQAESVLRAA